MELSDESEKFLKNSLLNNKYKNDAMFLYVFNPTPAPRVIKELERNNIIFYVDENHNRIALTPEAFTYFSNKRKRSIKRTINAIIQILTLGIGIATLIVSICK